MRPSDRRRSADRTSSARRKAAPGCARRPSGRALQHHLRERVEVVGGRHRARTRPDGKAGAPFHCPPTASSCTSGAPVSKFARYPVTSRSIFSGGTLKPVSCIPSGSKMRSRRKSRERLVRDARRRGRRARPRRCCTSIARRAGARAATCRSRRIHSSGAGGRPGRRWPCHRARSAESAVADRRRAGRGHDRCRHPCVNVSTSRTVIGRIGGHGARRAAVEPIEHLPVRELREPAVDRLVESAACTPRRGSSSRPR